jgi:hypothetical protein
MERLWIREVRRAARRASAPFARQVALGCGAAAVGTIVASVVPCGGMARSRRPCGPLLGQWLATWPSGPGSSSFTC